MRLPPSRLRVAWLDRRAGAFGNQVLGIYMTAAMTHLLRQSPAAEPGQWWQHTLCVLGAEKLPGEVLDGLCDASEASGTGLVIAYRSIPAPVKERLGRGNAAVAFMRLGNAEDAKTASEQIGTEHRFVLSQLTDTVGSSITDTGGDSYTSTVGTSDSVADSVSTSDTTGQSRGRGRSHQDAVAPFGHFTGSASRDSSYSRSTSDSRSLTEGINESTAWGLSTSRAVGGNESLARTAQRSREFLVEQHELQQLPPSAMIITYAAPEGRQVVLADANPGIMTLPTATLASLADARRAPGTVVPVQGWAPAGARPAGAGGRSAAAASRDGAGPASAKSADRDGAGRAGAGAVGDGGAGPANGDGAGPAADGPPPAGPQEAGRQDPVRGRDGCPGRRPPGTRTRRRPGTRTRRRPARRPRPAGPTPTGSRRLTSARRPSAWTGARTAAAKPLPGVARAVIGVHTPAPASAGRPRGSPVDSG